MFDFDPTIAVSLGFPASIIDRNGRRRLVSDQFAAVMRRSRGELEGVPWLGTTHVDEVGCANAMMQQVLSRDGPHAMRRRLIRGDGVVFEALVHGIRRPHPRGRGYVIHTIMSPVTSLAEAKSADADLHLPSDPAALLGIVQSRASALAAAVGGQNMRLLQHLLAMATAEAASELERLRPPGTFSKTPRSGSVH